MQRSGRPAFLLAALLVGVLAGCLSSPADQDPAAPPHTAIPTQLTLVGTKALVSTPGQRASEFWVRRDPTDPMRLALGRMEYTQLENFCLVALSTDGGRTWHDTARPFPGTASDPWVAWAPDGTLHTVCNVSHYAQSHDQGTTWDVRPKPDTPGYDRPAILVDSKGRVLHCSSMPADNAGPVVVYSDDLGATWARSPFTSISGSWEDTMCNSLEEGPDGTLFVALGLSEFRVAVSEDGGATWEERTRIDMADPRREDNGNLVPTHKEGNMYPSFDVSPTTGTLFAGVQGYDAAGNGGLGAYSIEVYRSRDQGVTFAKLTLPTAPAACDACDSTRAVVHVDDQGRLGLLWRTAELSLPVQTWFSASVDEGDTWLPPVLLSTESPVQGWWTPRSIDGADHYWSMADSPEGFLASWIDRTQDGWSSLWVQTVRLE